MTTTALIRSVIRTASPDGDAAALLAAVVDRDEAAFAEAIRRYGPMALGVCRRVLGPTADADDAFQATFLALFRHAAGIRTAAALPGWVHRTAFRTARKILARKPAAASPAEPAVAADPLADLSWREVRGLLDEELNALPEAVRGPLVLCYLEGRTRDDAAAALGVSTSTLKRRLATGLERLRGRLTRRGIGAVGLAAALLSGHGLVAQVPAALEARVAAAGLVPEAAHLFPSLVSAVRGWRGLMAAILVTAGLAAVGASSGQPQPPVARPAGAEKPEPPKPGVDALNDPLPDGAIARLGTSRLRGRRLTFSPDSRRVVRETANHDLQLYEVPSGKLLAKLRGTDVLERSEIIGSTIAFSPDSKLLAAVLWEGRAGLWETDTGKLIWWIESGKFYSVVECAFSPDGKLVAIGGATDTRVQAENFSIGVYEVGSGKKLFSERGTNGRFSDDGKTLAVWDGYNGPNPKLRAVPIAEPDKRVAHAFDTNVPNWSDPRTDGGSLMLELMKGGSVQVRDLKTGEVKRTLDGPKRAERGGVNLRHAPGRRELIATQAEPPALFCWNIDDGKLLWERDVPAKPYWADLSADGKTLVTAGKDGEVLTIDALTGKDRAVIPVRSVGHLNSQSKVSPNGKVVATFTASPEPGGGTVLFWDAATGKRLTDLPGHSAMIRDAVFAPDGTTVRTAGDDNTLRAWDAATGRELTNVPLPSPAQLAQSPDGKRLYASDAKGGAIRVVDPATGKVEATFPAFKKAVVGFAATADGKRLVVAGRDADEAGVIRVLDAVTGEKIREFATGDHRVEQMAASADGGVVATACAGRTLVVWSDEGRVLSELAGTGQREPSWKDRQPHYLIGSVAVTPRDGRVAFSDQEAGVGVIDGPSGKLVGHVKQSGVYFQNGAARYDVRDVLAVAPDGKTVAWSGVESTPDVFVIELSTRTVRRRFHGDSYPVKRLAYSPDGSKLLSTGPDGAALVWDVFARHPRQPAAAPDAKAVAGWWESLVAEDARAANTAMRAMAGRPEEALKLLREKLPPVAVEPAALDKLIADLGDRDFATREAATKKLGELTVAEGKLAAAAERGGSAEVRARAARALAHLRGARAIRAERAVEVLEWIGSDAARKLLAELAAGPSDTSLARDAKAAQARLSERTK